MRQLKAGAFLYILFDLPRNKKLCFQIPGHIYPSVYQYPISRHARHSVAGRRNIRYLQGIDVRLKM